MGNGAYAGEDRAKQRPSWMVQRGFALLVEQRGLFEIKEMVFRVAPRTRRLLLEPGDRIIADGPEHLRVTYLGAS